MEESEWKKSKLHNVAVEIENNGIHPNSIDDISEYIPRNKILTPAEIFKEGKRNEFTDAIVELLSKSAGTFYKSNDDMEEMFPDNRPKIEKIIPCNISKSEKEVAAGGPTKKTISFRRSTMFLTILNIHLKVKDQCTWIRHTYKCSR